MEAIFAPARKGDLCVLCERTQIMYLDRPAEEHRRWRVCRVARTTRGGVVCAVEVGGRIESVDHVSFDPREPIWVASREVVDVDAAVEAAQRERPDGFGSLDEVREFVRRFSNRSDAEEG